MASHEKLSTRYGMHSINNLANCQNAISCHNCTFQDIYSLSSVQGMGSCPCGKYPFNCSVPLRRQTQIMVGCCRLHPLAYNEELFRNNSGNILAKSQYLVLIVKTSNQRHSINGNDKGVALLTGIIAKKSTPVKSKSVC